MADRCRLFALSDCKDPAFYDDCKHSHDDCCDRCELLASTMDDEIDNTLVKNESNLSDDDCEEMRFLVKQAKAQIVSWKAHILRSIHQDSARINFLESLNESSVLVIQDWARKYLPRKYRESQTD